MLDESKRIIITFCASSIGFYIAGSGDIRIDYGDGHLRDYVLPDFVERNHKNYSCTDTYILVITGGEITWLQFDSTPVAKVELVNQTALTYVNMEDCAMQTEAINRMFRGLPVVEKGVVTVEDCLGADDCLPEIAREKGWTVHT